MTLIATNALSFIATTYGELPTTGAAPVGSMGYVTGTGKVYYSTNGTWVELTSGGGPGFPSYNTPPTSPSAYDDEFIGGSLDGKWSAVSVGTTNPIASGTVNPLSSLTTPIYDLTSQNSWILFQSDNSTVQTFGLQQSITPDTSATLHFKFSIDARSVSGAGEGGMYFNLINTGDSNEGAGVYMQSTGTGYRGRLRVSNNGAVSESTTVTMSEASFVPEFHLVLWKSSNTYYMGYTSGDGLPGVLGPVTKTGVTTFDAVEVGCYTANETPSIIYGLDFFRYYNSIKMGLMN